MQFKHCNQCRFLWHYIYQATVMPFSFFFQNNKGLSIRIHVNFNFIQIIRACIAINVSQQDDMSSMHEIAT